MEDTAAILKKFWGYDAFRPLQKEIIESILAGYDSLAVLPTGGGKSICFQVPALATEGICIVISPLVSLMKDQVENLKKRGIPALLIHSGLQRVDVVRTLENARNRYFKFLYVSPERLESSLFKEYLPALHVNLVAVDEAHCVSQWGPDFRPSYYRIAELRKELPHVPLLALTASATEEVQKDICERLQSPDARNGSDWKIFRQSFERKNLSYSVFAVDSKIKKLMDILGKVPGTAIVYCKSRKRTEEVSRLLQNRGISSAHYHAGLPSEERAKRQQDWLRNTVRVMVCTNAFGMGIDKPDVRVVIHLDIPDCLENYYQEAGRAGRDGKKSYAVLLYKARDLEELSLLPVERYPDLERIKHIYNAMVNYLQIPVNTGQDKSFTFRLDDFGRNFGLGSKEVLYVLKALESDGWIDFNEKNNSPSSVVFTIGKKELYEFEKSHPQHENLLTTLLRTYEGIFDFPSFISESFLARQFKKDEKEIKLQLKTIASFGIIQYVPQNQEPQLIFRKNRVAAEDLSFRLMLYYKRRDRFADRTKQMIDYSQATSCRSKWISLYFGDHGAADCGVCDNCIRNKKILLTDDELRYISSIIIQQVSHHELHIDTLLDRLSAIKKEKAWRVIQFLQAEKKLEVNKEGQLRVL